MNQVKRWFCKRFGHKWMGIGPFEHLCVTDACWRCWEQKVVHLWGDWPHTCKQYRR